MMIHTPGPWEWENGSLVSIVNDTVILWATYDKNLTSYIGINADDENLIKAAPELYEALDQLTRFCEMMDLPDDLRTIEKARKALDRVEV